MSYPGSKAIDGVFHRIINRMPPHEVYIEGFLGGGAIMRIKRPARVNIGIDLDPASLELTRAAGAAVWPENASYHLSLPMAGAAGLVRSNDGRPQFGFVLGDAISFMEIYPFTGQELVNLDPPYLRSTRSADRDRFRFEMEDRDHGRLLKAIVRCPARVMISGYWSKLYAERLKGWHVTSYNVMTRGGVREEFLWHNFPPPIALHDYSLLGSNWRERDRINRKTKRWIERFRRLPILERQALLAAVGTLANSDEEVLHPPLATSRPRAPEIAPD